MKRRLCDAFSTCLNTLKLKIHLPELKGEEVPRLQPANGDFVVSKAGVSLVDAKLERMAVTKLKDGAIPQIANYLQENPAAIMPPL